MLRHSASQHGRGVYARAHFDELLNGEIFYTIREAQIMIEAWRRHYNTIRPHSSLGYKPPAPEAIIRPATKPVAQMNSLN